MARISGLIWVHFTYRSIKSRGSFFKQLEQDFINRNDRTVLSLEYILYFKSNVLGPALQVNLKALGSSPYIHEYSHLTTSLNQALVYSWNLSQAETIPFQDTNPSIEMTLTMLSSLNTLTMESSTFRLLRLYAVSSGLVSSSSNRFAVFLICGSMTFIENKIQKDYFKTINELVLMWRGF